MKYLRLFLVALLAAFLVATAGIASAVPVIKISAADSSLSSGTAYDFYAIASNTEFNRANDSIAGFRKPTYTSTDRVASNAAPVAPASTNTAENSPNIVPQNNLSNQKVSYDQPSQVDAPMTSPLAWLLLLFGIGFVALQSGRRSSSVSASKLQ